MRYSQYLIKLEDGTVHPVDAVIAETPEIAREALIYVDRLVDGTYVVLYRLRGEVEPLMDHLNVHSSVITSALVDTQENTHHLYLHVEPGQPADQLLLIVQEYALILLPPLEFTERGLRVMICGSHEMITQAIEAVTDTAPVRVEQIGQYSPDDQHRLASLTDRQREVLETAVRVGYYDHPRESTQKDLADELGCAPSTVDQHLRKAETRILASVIQ